MQVTWIPCENVDADTDLGWGLRFCVPNDTYDAPGPQTPL